MKGIVVPERTEDFTADPVELFFDLAYVFAFSQLTARLLVDPDWAGTGKAALLFGLMWLPWQQFTWSANAVSGNGRSVRILFLIATAVSVPMAASVSTAYGPGGPVFAITIGVIVVIGVSTMALGLERGSSVFQANARWAATNVVALALLGLGAFVGGDARIVLWASSLLVVVANTVAAGRGEWIIRSGHFAERHGLIVIIALGEVVVAVGAPVVSELEREGGLPASTVVVLVAAGAFAGLLWWAYFDRPGPALEHRGEGLEGDRERGRYFRDVYTWAHAPIVAGVVLAAAALERISLHPSEAVEGRYRLMLFGGLALGVTGIAAAVWRAFRAVARERIAAVVVLGLVLAVGGSWDGVVLLLVVDAVIAATLVVENVRIER